MDGAGFSVALVYSVGMQQFLTSEQEQRCYELALQGKTNTQVCEDIGVSVGWFWSYRQANPKFAQEYARCLVEGIDASVDRLLDITKEFRDVQEARLMSDNIKWAASKRRPQVYGDRIDVHVQHTVSIRDALEEGKRRAGLIRDVSPQRATGTEPVALPAAPQRALPDAPQNARQTAPDTPATRRAVSAAPSGTPAARDVYRPNKRAAPDATTLTADDLGLTAEYPDAEVLSGS